MYKQTNVVIWVFVLIVTVAGAKNCFDEKQNEALCGMAHGMSKIPPALIQTLLAGMTDKLENMFGKLSDKAMKLITTTVSKCPIQSHNDQSIASMFKFTIYSPREDKPQVLSGDKFVQRSRKDLKQCQNFDYTIFLWPGWLDKCPKPVGFKTSDWSQRSAQELSNQANAQVIDIDWGSSGLSCCNYLELVFCHIDAITKWMGNRIIDSSANGFTAPIERTWKIGHSLGVHFSTYTAEYVFSKTGRKMYNMIAMDPAGPFFAAEQSPGRCQSLMIDYFHNSTAIYTNPNLLGTGHFNNAHVKILSNSKKNFCQHGCEKCDAICCHSYAPQNIFDKLIKKQQLSAKYLSGTDEPFRNVTMFERMEHGFYDLAPDYNPGVFDIIQ